MRATFFNDCAGLRISDRKERHFSEEFIGIAVTQEGIREVVNLKLYQTDAQAYCCAWISAGEHRSGSGRAGGYGYHRASAAAGLALRAAGVALDEDIDGCGDGAIRAAVEAVARAAYPDAVAVHVVHAHP